MFLTCSFWGLGWNAALDELRGQPRLYSLRMTAPGHYHLRTFA